jgi:hypothetical protein
MWICCCRKSNITISEWITILNIRTLNQIDTNLVLSLKVTETVNVRNISNVGKK